MNQSRRAWFAVGCAVVVLLTAVLILAEWLAGVALFTRPGDGYVPMAPLTAALFILLGGTILYHARRGADAAVRPIARVAPVIVIIFSGLLLAQFLARIIFGIESDFERVIGPAPGFIGLIPLYRMSPLAALLFMLIASQALLFPIPRFRRIGETIGAAVAAIALVLVIGYWYGEPLLYGGSVVPVALSTAVLFLLSALALFTADPGSLLVRLVTGNSVQVRIFRSVAPAAILFVLFHGWLGIRIIDMMNIQYFVVLDTINSLGLALIIAFIAARAGRKVDAHIRQAEAATRASELEFRSLAEAMPQIVWTTRPDGWNTYFNQQWVDYTGLTQAESRGNGWSTPFHPEDRQRAMETWQRATQNIGVYSLECRLRRADGVYHWWLIRGAPMRAASGEILKWFGTCTDIEEIKQMEGELRLNLERSDRVRRAMLSTLEDQKQTTRELSEAKVLVDTIIESIPLMIFLKDATDMRFVVFNNAGEELLGYDRKDLLGKNNYDLFPAEQAAFFMAKDQEALASAAGMLDIPEEPVLTAKRGERLLHTRKICIRGANGITKYLLGISEDITDRKQAEITLREHDGRLQSIIDNVPDLVWLKDCESRFITVNEAFGLTCGRRPADMAGKTDLDVWPKELADHYRLDDAVVIATGKRKQLEEQLSNSNGQLSWVETIKTPVRNEVGAIIGTTGIARDITMRRQVIEAQKVLNHILERALQPQALEEILGDVLDSILGLTWLDVEPRGAILLTAADGRTLEMTAQRGLSGTVFCSCRTVPFGNCLCGLAAQTGEIQFADQLDSRHTVTFAGMVDHGHYCIPLAVEEKTLGVLNLYLKSGSKRVARDEQFLLTVARTVAGVVVKKRAEAEIKRLNSVVEQAVEGVIITDPNGVIEYVNHAFVNMTGYAASEAIGRKPSILKSDKQDQAFYQNLWKTILAGRVFSTILVNRRKDGALYHEEKVISPLKNEAGIITHYVAFARDVTAQKQVADLLRQAQKMEAVGQLAGGIVHDFNNILGIILNNAELGLEGLDPQNPRYEYLHEIQTAGRRSAEMVRQLLAFSRKEVMNPRIVNLNDLLADHLRMLRRMIGEDIIMRLIPADDIWNIRIDPSQISQILTNLTLNARDAIAGVGTITIITANVVMDAAACRNLAGLKPGEYVRLIFDDSGIGMPPETLEHMFEPFFSTKGGKGTGLGLATIYGIVKQNHGFVYVASEPGRGSTFTLYLPRVANADAVRESASAAPAALRPGSETVLVVDDEEKLSKVIRTIFTRQGYTVLTANTAAAACRLAADHPGTIHLLLSDVIMPEMNGRDLQAKIAALQPGIRTIFMSGHTADVLTYRGLLATEAVLIEKPFTTEALLRQVRSVLDSGAKDGDLTGG